MKSTSKAKKKAKDQPQHGIRATLTQSKFDLFNAYHTLIAAYIRTVETPNQQSHRVNKEKN